MRTLIEFLFRLRPGELDGADSWAPSFAAGYNNWVILGLAVVFLVLVALTILCYLREGENPRRVKLTIASLRIVVIVLLLALLFEPGLVLRYRKTLYSTVVVLLDDSLSMSLRDRYTKPAEREALAKKLGVDADSLLETARLDIVRRILAGQGGALAALSRDHPLVLLRFSTPQPGREAYTRPLAALDYTSATGSEKEVAGAVQRELSEALASLSAGGYETNLAAALRDAADRLQGQRVSGIVLVSDGQATTTGDSAGRLNAALAYVRQRGIPVFAVGVGDDEPPKNVMVLRLQAPAEARQGATVEMTAYLSHRNCEGKNVQVRLLRRALKSETWDDAEASEEVTLSQKGEVQEVKLQTRAEALGEYVYKAVAQALQDEFTEEDNFATAKVKVSEEKVKILLVSGDAGWEFQYLRNLLLRSPDRYAVSVWQQNADSKFNQQASSGMKLTQLPRTAAELYKYEVVILYDPAYTEGGFDKQFVDMLEGFVDKHHGGLCYIASNKYSDSNLVTSAEEFPFVGLANVLPVVLGHRTIHIAERIGREPTAYPVVPTPVGLDHPALRFGSDAGETLSIWRSLPGAYWSHPVIRMKPLASSLAVSTDPLNRLADDPSQPAPLIAVQYYGKGRSLFIGFDETWRWRYLTDGYYYRLFWHNVMDFLAAGRLQSKRIIITTGADRFAVGENLRIHVEAYGRNYEPLEEETFEVEMINAATKAVQKIVLQRDPKKKLAGHYEATLPLKTQGSFELTAKREDPSYKDEVAGKTITVALPEEEFRHPEADLAMLETIAPEGRFLRIHESGGLAGLVPSGKMSVFHDVPHELWDVPLAIVVIVLLLAAEWILRKKYNMV